MFTSFIIFHIVVICTAVRYDNYTYFRAIPSKNSHLNLFRGIKDMGFDINFWSEPGTLGKPIEFTIAPDNKTSFLQKAKAIKMAVSMIHDNIQSLFDEETRKFHLRSDSSFNWDHYFGLKDIYAWLKDLALKRGPEIEIHTIGRTAETRQLLAVKIILKGSLRRSKVVIEGGIHAREWISPAFVTYLIGQILNASTSDNEGLKKMAMTYEWFFIPVLNPDGYEYTHRKDRMWRKNRNGMGIDLNRNFGHKFGVASTRNPNDESYCGPNAFSENESLAWSNYIQFIGEGVEYYLSFHSYSQLMILPYGHSKQHLDNYNDVHKMASEAAVAIKSKYKTVYKIGTAYETVGYTGGGMSMCWIKQTFKVPYVITFELRDQGHYGFALPSRLIMPTCLETVDGLINLLRPRGNTFNETKAKFKKTVEKYHASRSDPLFFLKKIIILSVICNKLLAL